MSESSEAARRAIREAAAERNRLHAEGARAPDARPELVAAYSATYGFIGNLRSPGALARLAASDPEAIEAAVCFFEVYPFCPDSGFVARDLAKTLVLAEIPDAHAVRLRAALFSILKQPQRDEFKYLRRIALKVTDEDFVLALDRLTEERDVVLAENARQTAAYVTLNRESPPWLA